MSGKASGRPVRALSMLVSRICAHCIPRSPISFSRAFFSPLFVRQRDTSPAPEGKSKATMVLHRCRRPHLCPTPSLLLRSTLGWLIPLGLAVKPWSNQLGSHVRFHKKQVKANISPQILHCMHQRSTPAKVESPHTGEGGLRPEAVPPRRFRGPLPTT